MPTEATERHNDAIILRAAADVLQRRLPRTFIRDVLALHMRKVADWLDRQA